MKMGDKISKKLIIFTLTLAFAILICGTVSAASADVQVNQTVNKSTPNINDNVTINTTVTNNGPDTATNVQINCSLPSGVTLNNYTTSQGTYNATTGIWDVGTITNGKIVTLLLNVQIIQTGTIENSAIKTAETETDPNVGNNLQKTVFNVPHVADIRVKNYVYVGIDTWTYYNTPVMVVDIYNNGPDDATGVIIQYILPQGMEFVSSDTRGYGTYTYNSTTRTITWYLGSIANRGAAYMDVYVLLTQVGSLTTTAKVNSSDQYDNDNSNNQKQKTITVQPSADVQVQQTVNNTNPTVGDTITFTITVTNNGPSTADSVIVNDLLNSNLKYISNAVYNGTTWIINSSTYNNSTGIWTIGTITNGKTLILNITALVTKSGTIKNNASSPYTLSQTTSDWNKSNNAKIVVLNVSEGGLISVESNNSIADIRVKNYVYVGIDTWTYYNTPVMVVDIYNNGPDDATGVIIQYILPQGMEFVSSDTRGYGTYTYNSTTRTITWYLGSIANRGAAYMDVYVLLTQVGSLTTTAKVNSSDQYDNDNSNNQKQKTITVQPSADVQVQQTVNNTNPTVGDTITFTITVTNNGPSTADSVIVNDLLNSNLKYISNAVYNGTTWIINSSTYNNSTGIWTIGTITNGKTLILNITALVTKSGTIKNNASSPYTLSQTTSDWNKSNNAKIVYLQTVDSSHVLISQEVSTEPNYLDTVTLTINATNQGPNPVTNLKITDLLNSNIQLISSTTSLGTSYNSATGVWNIGTLPNENSVTLLLFIKLLKTGIINNTVTTTSQDQYDPVGYENNTLSLNIPKAADIQITETTPPTVNFGDQICVFVTAQNNGPDTANNVQVKISLPSGFFYSSHSGGSYDPTTGIWTVGSLLNGTYTTLNIIGTILTTSSFTINSTKTAENEYDYNLTNDAVSKAVSIDMGNVVSFSSVDDGSSSRITLPFTVYLFDRSYNTFYINVNGLVSFTDTISDYIPDPNIDEAFIAPFWDDIYLTGGAAVYYKVDGDTVTITWVKVPSYLERNNPTKFNTFQLRILRNSSTGDTIYGFVYGDMQWKVGYKNGNTNGKSFAGFGGDLRNWFWYYHTYTTFWTSSGALSQLTNQTFWFNHSGMQIAAPVFVDPDIDVTQIASTYNPSHKETFNITVTVVNLGPEATSGIQILDQIPDGLKLVSANPSKGTYDSSTGIWTIGNLDINETVTLTLKVNAHKRGTYINHAEKISQVEYDPNSENDASDITITVS